MGSSLPILNTSWQLEKGGLLVRKGQKKKKNTHTKLWFLSPIGQSEKTRSQKKQSQAKRKQSHK